MADIKVIFLHPTDGRKITVDIDDSMTASEAISELIAGNIISTSTQGYNLAVKGGNMINGDQSFREAGVLTDTPIRIIPATDAG